MDPKFIGPTYQLPSRPASVQRTVNMLVYPMEPGNERTRWAFEDAPGLEVFNEPPVVATGWDSSNETGSWVFTNSDFTGEVL